MPKANPWLEHVAKYRAQHPNMKYKDVLIEAKKTYVSSPRSSKQRGGNLAEGSSAFIKAMSDSLKDNSALIDGRNKKRQEKMNVGERIADNLLNQVNGRYGASNIAKNIYKNKVVSKLGIPVVSDVAALFGAGNACSLKK